ncbi:MAG: IS200/IS605 family transposase [Anaerolineae bacterium]|nr:IS200/IS605 family transposase [Anaerolineae bacterium]
MPYWRLFYHFVWGTKNREPLIAPEWEDSLHNVIAAKATELGALVHAVGGTEDHAHLVVSVPPKIALSTFIGQVKGNSSHFVNHELNVDIHFAWQAEYGVVSFGGKMLDVVAGYAKNQRKHHTEGTTIAMLEQVVPERARG